MLEKTYCVGVVAQSVEPWIPEKIGGRAWVRVPPTPVKRCLFFKWVLVLIMQTGKPFRFHTPSSILVVGPSGCGKTVFTETLVRELRLV